MHNKEILSKVESLASEVAQREGLKLYDIEMIGAGHHRTLRIYIDKVRKKLSKDDSSLQLAEASSLDKTVGDQGQESATRMAEIYIEPENKAAGETFGSVETYENLPVVSAAFGPIVENPSVENPSYLSESKISSEAISVNDCAQYSRALNLVLDVEDVIPGGSYSLEVSSPGLERQLRKPWHFEGVVGKKIWIKSKRPFSEQGYTNPQFQKSYQLNFILTKTSETGMSLDDGSGEFHLPWEDVEKANLVFEYGIPDKERPSLKPGQKSGKAAKAAPFGKTKFGQTAGKNFAAGSSWKKKH